jgi:hypothetical protein
MENKESHAIDQLIEELDKKGTIALQKVLQGNKELATSGTSINTTQKCAVDKFQTDLLSIMTNGAKEFEKKAGRPMTYAEMRQAYG